jgi:hypothetical protein
MRWAGYVVRVGNRRDEYKVLVGKPEGKRPLWTPKHRWEDNIKMDEDMDGIDVPHKRSLVLSVVNVLMNLQVP